MATIVIEVPCGGERHHIEVRDDGSVRMLDHNEDMVRSFVEFGAAAPDCLVELEDVRERPARLVIHDAHDVNDRTRSLLTCDAAEHVLNIYEAIIPDDNRPRRAIDTVRAYWHGDAPREQIEVTLAAAKEAEEEALAPPEATSGWGDAEEEVAARADAASRAAGAARRAAEMGMGMATASAVSAAGYAAYAKRLDVTDFDKAMAAERRWQRARIVKVLDAIEKGDAWPRLS